MSDWNYVFFDLDGTLTDPKTGITLSAAYALSSFGIGVEDTESLCKFIGPPLRDSFMEFCGFSKEQADLGIQKFRERYEKIGWKENRPYPGIEKLLGKLKSAGKRLFVATSKPEVMAERILAHFGMDGYFELIAGADLEEIRVKKADVLRYAMGQLEGIVKEESVMVGDRMHDIAGAKEVGINAIGVLYGYGSREELLHAGADNIAASVQELEEMLIK